MKNFDGKVAAITGAASGMGRSLAIQLAEQGCGVSISDVNEKGLAETAKMAEKAAAAAGKNVKVTTQTLDVSNREAVYAWADQTAKDHGKVNLIFNNAGVALGATVEGASYEDLEWIMGINFWGVVYGTKAFLPYLKAAGEGHVINTSSIFGLFSQPSQCGYNASKFAVRGFTESLRQELDIANCGVSATCVHPGGIKTAIARSARFTKSVTDMLGQSEEAGKSQFEKLFITSADKAARIILDAVKGDKRRILVGPDAVAADTFIRLLGSQYQPFVVNGVKAMAKKAAARALKGAKA